MSQPSVSSDSSPDSSHLQTPVFPPPVELRLTAGPLATELSAAVRLATKEIPTLAVSEETVSPTLNVEIIKLVKTTNVLILAKHLVALELNVKLTIM